MPFFKNVFKSKDGPRSSSKASKYPDQTDGGPVAQPKRRWEDAWSRKDVAPEEVQELIHVCTQEMKSRALDMPFLLLPFRPASDPSAARTFIRTFFKSAFEGGAIYRGEGLQQELRLTEPLVLCSIMKWCWSRLPGGVVTWDVYELFRIGESDSNFARHSFDTFIPLSVDSEARRQIIFDFFDLLSAVAARGKTNGLGGRKLSRMAGWWAFEHSDNGKGFDGGYKSWARAADAASHLFFAYLRSLSPDSVSGISGISTLPRSLQALLSQTEYPPQTPTLMQSTTTKVVMIVDSVSPTPFALLRRAKHFEYRDDDEALQHFSSYEDPVKALTDECRRVLTSISSTNQSVLTPSSPSQDASWSRFEDLGFSGLNDAPTLSSMNGSSLSGGPDSFSGLRSGPRTRNTDFGRPTTPSWADFLSSGFADENGQTSPSPFLLPPDKQLPPIGETARVHSSQSHVRHGAQPDDLEPGELASITQFDLDDTFWWVWMTSLAGEEPTERKAVFGRCTLIETLIPGAKWLVIEEQVKGASPGPEEGAYIAEKKGRFSFTRRGRLGRRKSTGKKPPVPTQDPYDRKNTDIPMSKTSIGTDQHARIQAAAARLARKQQDEQIAAQAAQRRARKEDSMSVKTNSVMTLQPLIMKEAAPAMKWINQVDGKDKTMTDKEAIRAKYLGDIRAGKGSRDNLLAASNGYASSVPREGSNRDLPALPQKDQNDPESRASGPAYPTPLPSVPNPGVAKSQRAEASAAAQVPLPAATPTLATPLDEKPMPHDDELDELDQHPAFRKPIPERKPVAEFKPSVAEDIPSHEQPIANEAAPVKKSPPKKLKKNAGGGGFRKLFGKKKADAPTRSETPQPTEPESNLQSPQTQAKATQGVNITDDSPASTLRRPQEVSVHSPGVEMSPAVSAMSPKYHNDREQAEADHAFARFDQGPMDDMPAFAPEDSDHDVDVDSMAAHPSSIIPTPAGYHDEMHRQLQDPEDYAEHEDDHSSSMDDASEQSVDLTRQVSPSQDRWAQIRKNAAERAARLSEEQSRRSQSQSNRTDEGETSGEETIESRVARIKARVAELTGNMDGQGNTTPTGRR